MVKLINRHIVGIIAIITILSHTVSPTLITEDIISTLYHVEPSLLVKEVPYRNSNIENKSPIDMTICCTDMYCSTEYTNEKLLVEVKNGCFDNRGIPTNQRGCTCVENPPNEYQPCTAINNCFCGPLPIMETKYLLDKHECAVRSLKVYFDYFKDRPISSELKSIRGDDECNAALNNNTFFAGKLLLRCPMIKCRYSILADSGYNVYEMVEGAALSVNIADKYSKTASVAYFLEGPTCTTQTTTLTNEPISYCEDQHSTLTISSLLHPECFTGAIHAWLIFFWILLGILFIGLFAVGFLILRCCHCFLCCPCLGRLWERCGMRFGRKFYALTEAKDDHEQHTELLPSIELDTDTQPLEPEGIAIATSSVVNTELSLPEESTWIRAPVSVVNELVLQDGVFITIDVNGHDAGAIDNPLENLLSSPTAAKMAKTTYQSMKTPTRSLLVKNNIKTAFPYILAWLAATSMITAKAAICTSINLIQSTVPTCSTQNGIKTCTSNLNMRFTIPSIGGNSCYELYDDQKNMIYKLSLSTSQVGYEYGTNLSYYTTMGCETSTLHDNEYTVYCKNSCTDSAIREYCKGGHNPLWTSAKKRGYMAGSDKYWSNMQCASKCEGWWDCYYGWQVRPKLTSSAKVYRITSARSYAVVTITEVTPSGTVSTPGIRLYSGSSLPVKFGLVQVENIIPSNLPLINQYSLVAFNDAGTIKYLLTDAAPKEMGVIGKIGEIQCSNAECTSNGVSKYYVSPDWLSLQKDLTSDSVRVYFPTFSFSPDDMLPRSVSGWDMRVINNEIRATSTGNHKVDLFASYSGVVSIAIEQTIPLVTTFDAKCERATGTKEYHSFTYRCASNTEGCPLYCHDKSGSKTTVDYLTCNDVEHIIPHLSVPLECTHYTCGDLAVSPACVLKEYINITGFEVSYDGDSTSTKSLSWGDWSIGSQLASILVPALVVIIIVVIMIIVFKVLSLCCFRK